MGILVVEHCKDWAVQFLAIKKVLWPLVSDCALRIEHVGSTAVEGLWAKPILDIDIVIENELGLSQIADKLKKLNYQHVGNLGIEGREAFKIKEPDFPHHLYVCFEDSLALRNHIILRDHLRKHKADRDLYSELKRDLAQAFPDEMDSYVAGKTDFIQSILKRNGLQPTELESIRKINSKSPL